MKKIVVEQFGEVDVLQMREFPMPEPGPGFVRVRVTSIGMNHADLMARRGEYIISSGKPPFTPGIEAGGVIDALGEGVTGRQIGQRILIGADATESCIETDGTGGGTYRTHYLVRAEKTVPAPAALPDDQLGAIWLPYLTAWGCLVWKQDLKPGQFVAIPAASSSVGLAAAQIAKKRGAIPIALTSTESKIAALKALPESAFDHYVATHNADGMRSWHKDLRRITGRHGVDVFFDPVAAGDYLEMEIHALAPHGTIWIYGLLGQVGKLDVTPLIRKFAAIRGWYLKEVTSDAAALQRGYDELMAGFSDGSYRQCVAKTYRLDDVQAAHSEMETGRHIGKLILIP